MLAISKANRCKLNVHIYELMIIIKNMLRLSATLLDVNLEGEPAINEICWREPLSEVPVVDGGRTGSGVAEVQGSSDIRKFRFRSLCGTKLCVALGCQASCTGSRGRRYHFCYSRKLRQCAIVPLPPEVTRSSLFRLQVQVASQLDPFRRLGLDVGFQFFRRGRPGHIA